MSQLCLSGFIRAIQHKNLRVRGIEVWQHGEKVAEHRWAPDYRYPVHSISKSFTSAAVGMAIEDGLFGLKDPVLKYFPEYAPKDPDNAFHRLTVWNLLTMSTGHVCDSALRPEQGPDEDDGVRQFFSIPLETEPGAFFCYDGGATYMLSALLQQTTGQRVQDYLKPRLFDPLGIENVGWDTCPKGRNLGRSGLYLKTSELGKLGRLYLQKGVWEGRQLVPADWVAESGKAQMDNSTETAADNVFGYGYKFWRCSVNAYRADGYLGQFAIIADDLDAVIAVSSWEPNAQAILTTLWATVWPQLEQGV